MGEHLFTHDPREHPVDCLGATLHELAFEAHLTGKSRRETFNHGEVALAELARQVESLRQALNAAENERDRFGEELHRLRRQRNEEA